MIRLPANPLSGPLGEVAPCFAFGARIHILKHEMDAMVEIDKAGTKVLVKPTTLDKDPTPCTVTEMLDEFKSALGMTDEQTKAITDGIDTVCSSSETKPKIDMGKTKILLNNVYLYLNTPKDTGQQKESEYSVGLDVDLQEAMPDFGFFRIYSLYLKVWKLPEDKREKLVPDVDIEQVRASLFS